MPTGDRQLTFERDLAQVGHVLARAHPFWPRWTDLICALAGGAEGQFPTASAKAPEKSGPVKDANTQNQSVCEAPSLHAAAILDELSKDKLPRPSRSPTLDQPHLPLGQTPSSMPGCQEAGAPLAVEPTPGGAEQPSELSAVRLQQSTPSGPDMSFPQAAGAAAAITDRGDASARANYGHPQPAGPFGDMGTHHSGERPGLQMTPFAQYGAAQAMQQPTPTLAEMPAVGFNPLALLQAGSLPHRKRRKFAPNHQPILGDPAMGVGRGYPPSATWSGLTHALAAANESDNMHLTGDRLELIDGSLAQGRVSFSTPPAAEAHWRALQGPHHNPQGALWLAGLQRPPLQLQQHSPPPQQLPPGQMPRLSSWNLALWASRGSSTFLNMQQSDLPTQPALPVITPPQAEALQPRELSPSGGLVGDPGLQQQQIPSAAGGTPTGQGVQGLLPASDGGADEHLRQTALQLMSRTHQSVPEVQQSGLLQQLPAPMAVHAALTEESLPKQIAQQPDLDQHPAILAEPTSSPPRAGESPKKAPPRPSPQKLPPRWRPPQNRIPTASLSAPTSAPPPVHQSAAGWEATDGLQPQPTRQGTHGWAAHGNPVLQANDIFHVRGEGGIAGASAHPPQSAAPVPVASRSLQPEHPDRDASSRRVGPAGAPAPVRGTLGAQQAALLSLLAQDIGPPAPADSALSSGNGSRGSGISWIPRLLHNSHSSGHVHPSARDPLSLGQYAPPVGSLARMGQVAAPAYADRMGGLSLGQMGLGAPMRQSNAMDSPLLPSRRGTDRPAKSAADGVAQGPPRAAPNAGGGKPAGRSDPRSSQQQTPQVSFHHKRAQPQEGHGPERGARSSQGAMSPPPPRLPADAIRKDAAGRASISRPRPSTPEKNFLQQRNKPTGSIPPKSLKPQQLPSRPSGQEHITGQKRSADSHTSPQDSGTGQGRTSRRASAKAGRPRDAGSRPSQPNERQARGPCGQREEEARALADQAHSARLLQSLKQSDTSLSPSPTSGAFKRWVGSSSPRPAPAASDAGALPTPARRVAPRLAPRSADTPSEDPSISLSSSMQTSLDDSSMGMSGHGSWNPGPMHIDPGPDLGGPPGPDYKAVHGDAPRGIPTHILQAAVENQKRLAQPAPTPARPVPAHGWAHGATLERMGVQDWVPASSARASSECLSEWSDLPKSSWSDMPQGLAQASLSMSLTMKHA